MATGDPTRPTLGRGPRRARGSQRLAHPGNANRAVSAVAARDDGRRRAEILRVAASMIASSGLRTSLRDIGDAVGIHGASLYYHFESKEAILIELLQCYHGELDRIGADGLAAADPTDERPIADKVIALGSAIAGCAVSHQAALQMLLYEAPGASHQLIELIQRRPTAVQDAMMATLRAGQRGGEIRSDVDLPPMADRICQAMLQIGLDVVRHRAHPDQVATVLGHIILDGLACHASADSELDGSRALAAANNVIQTWTDDSDAGANDTLAHIRTVARTEFGRKGYEFTTLRDIAAAAGVPVGTVHRLIGSKGELLESIMRSFRQKIGAGWVSVVRSDATPVEKLDAMAWVNINALDQFFDEFRIQLAWMRQCPPEIPNPGWSYSARLRQIKQVLSDGVRSGDIHVDAPSIEMPARCLIGMQWIHGNVLQTGKRAALIHARDALLRGVANRRQ